MRLKGILTACLLVLASSIAGGQQWAAPTAEELAMTSVAKAPGAPAVYLYREEVQDDANREIHFFFRLKVLTEGGKKYANVELPYEADSSGFSIADLDGRTIQPDGTVVPLKGKPFEKLVEQGRGFKVKAKVFTLPAAGVGSILEYRYKLRGNSALDAPDWYPQSEVFLRRAHYEWKPQTSDMLATTQIAMTAHLPHGTEVKNAVKNGFFDKSLKFSMDVEDVPPVVKEPFMPPAVNVGYSVNFYYTRYKTKDEFWSETGKLWSEVVDVVAAPGPGVKAFVEKTVQPGDTAEQKLKRLYDAVMRMDNTTYMRALSEREEKAKGLKLALSSDEVLNQSRGSEVQLTALFVAMARAAGFKAYMGFVTDRAQRLFNSSYLSYGQFHQAVAIVVVDGKEVYFDPGNRYTEFKHLSWWHAATGGIRQTETGTALFKTPGEVAKTAHVMRVADLTLDEHGEATGTVKVTSTGDAAHQWREHALMGDETSVRADLRSEMEGMLPKGMEVKVTEVQNLTDPDKPLIVQYEVKGGVGAATGKRLVVPACLFQVNDTARFPEAKRETTVMMPYASFYQDAIRLRYPTTMQVESMPEIEELRLKNMMQYERTERQTSESVFSYRNIVVAQNAIPMDEYDGLRDFYRKVEAKDQEPVVLVRVTAVADGGK